MNEFAKHFTEDIKRLPMVSPDERELYKDHPFTPFEDRDPGSNGTRGPICWCWVAAITPAAWSDLPSPVNAPRMERSQVWAGSTSFRPTIGSVNAWSSK